MIKVFSALIAFGALSWSCAIAAASAATPAGAARAYVHQKLPGCQVHIHQVTQNGGWASIYADCRGHEGDSVMNLYARKTAGIWTVVCGHGDDDGGPGFAQKCGMPRATSKAFGYHI